MEESQSPYVQVGLEVPREVAEYLEALAKSVGANRRSIIRSMLIVNMRKIQSLKEPPSTLGDIESAINEIK